MTDHVSDSDNSAAPTPQRRGKRAFLLLAVAALVVLGSLGAYAFFTADQRNTDDAMVEADVVQVTARVGGMIASLAVHDNQHVSRGDVLLQIDDADFVARVAQARAELQTAVAQAAGAHAQAHVVQATARGGLQGAQAQASGSGYAVQSADASIASAEAGLARAEAEATKAEHDLARMQRLVAASAVAQTQLEAQQLVYDSAQAALVQARANVTAAREAKRTAQSRVNEAEARVSQSTPVSEQIAAAQASAALADARVKAAEAAVRLAELQLSYTKVLAPADGLVTQLAARQGAQVQAGQPMAQLVPPTTYLVANFKETQIDGMRPGDTAEVEIDAFPGRAFQAKVASLSAGTGSRFSLLPPDNASGNFVKVVQRVPVRLEWVRTPDVPLKAGLSADVTVRLQGKAVGQ